MYKISGTLLEEIIKALNEPLPSVSSGKLKPQSEKRKKLAEKIKNNFSL